jgi:hypothetical protein
MRVAVPMLACLVSLAALRGDAQEARPTLRRGDVLAISYASELPDPATWTYYVDVYARDGSFKGTLASFPGRDLTDLFYRDGIIYLAARNPGAIERIDSSGNPLPTFAAIPAKRLGPGPGGGVLATGFGGALWQLASDGTVVRFRSEQEEFRAWGTPELATDGCTVFFLAGGSAVARWDACLNTPVTLWTAPPGYLIFEHMRLLPDGTFLAAQAGGRPPIHFDALGNILRTYAVGSVPAIALDIDGTSFWTSDCMRRLDIATGAVLTNQCHGAYFALAVVGEPRAGLPALAPDQAIPTASGFVLSLMACVLALIAVLRMR